MKGVIKMRSEVKLFRIIAIVAVISFSIIACESGSTGSDGTTTYADFEGYWVDSSWGGSFTFNGNSYVFREGSTYVNGTFTYTNTEITLTPNDPTTPAEFRGVMTYVLSGNRLTLSKADGVMSGVFVKQ